MVVSRMSTAIVIFAASSTSISAAGSGTMITSTLVIIATGRIKSWPRPSNVVRESPDPAPAPVVRRSPDLALPADNALAAKTISPYVRLQPDNLGSRQPQSPGDEKR